MPAESISPVSTLRHWDFSFSFERDSAHGDAEMIE
jgi:hypothetical protein